MSERFCTCVNLRVEPSCPMHGRKPYVPPKVTRGGYIGVPSAEIPLSVKVYWLLRAGSDASGVNWYEPQELLRAVQREVELALDSETRAKLAASGFDVRGEAESPAGTASDLTRTLDSCRCVNPPRLAIGEIACPACGLARAIIP